MDTWVLTAIGDDRPGLVSALSTALSTHGASWERSQMARLAGKFAGIVEVAVPPGVEEGLLADLERLGAHGLVVSVARTDAPAPRPTQRLVLSVVGADRPGIVAEISSLLSEHGVSIEELGTQVAEAPMAGGLLFEGHAVLTAGAAGAAAADTAALRAALEQVADELMVDIDLVVDPG